jgi:hypothetical protein
MANKSDHDGCFRIYVKDGDTWKWNFGINCPRAWKAARSRGRIAPQTVEVRRENRAF